MMTPDVCFDKAAACDAKAAATTDEWATEQWLTMAAEWRLLAGDANAAATTARVMKAGRGVAAK